LLRPRSVNFRQHFRNLSRKTVPLKRRLRAAHGSVAQPKPTTYNPNPAEIVSRCSWLCIRDSRLGIKYKKDIILSSYSFFFFDPKIGRQAGDYRRVRGNRLLSTRFFLAGSIGIGGSSLGLYEHTVFARSDLNVENCVRRA
jgi:hypothetical protein